MTLNYFTAYFFIVLLATIIPGPSMLLALNHGANHGMTKTLYSGLGNMIGNLLIALTSILGLGIVLIASGMVFNIIKWLGVIYISYIGLRMIVDPIKTNEQNRIQVKASSEKNRMRLFIDGFLIAISNPKGIVFFTALFPQFININQASANEFLIVFITLGLVAFGCYMLYAVFGVKLNRLFHLKSFRKIFNRITGSLMIGVGLTIAFSK